jgi:hypothetical protein
MVIPWRDIVIPVCGRQEGIGFPFSGTAKRRSSRVPEAVPMGSFLSRKGKLRSTAVEGARPAGGKSPVRGGGLGRSLLEVE